jgi:hypothetical protein
MSLCILVRTLKKSASRFSIASADATVSIVGSDSSHDRRIVVVVFESCHGSTRYLGVGSLG